MIGRSRVFSVVCTWALFFAGGTSAQASPPFQVEATVDHKGKELTVSFRITNIAGNAATINESALPWGDRYGVLLFVVTKRDQQPLKARYPVSDVFVEKPVRLESKASINGIVELSGRFGDLSTALSKDDLLVFWFYEPKDTKRAELGQYGGWLLVPKTKTN